MSNFEGTGKQMAEKTVAVGVFDLGPKEGWLHLNTWKQGLFSRLGHDLLLSVEDFAIHVEHPSESADIRVSVRVSEAAFVVLGPESLSEKDKAEIKSNIKGHLKSPLMFEGTLKNSGQDWFLSGQLRLGKGSCALQIPLQQKATMVSGKARISHAALGIEPYKAPFGLLQLKDEIDLSFQVDIASLLR